MNAIILKELRENLKWAALGLLGISIALAMAVSSAWNIGFVFEGTTVATIGGFSTIALALGLLQVFQDRWRGRFAFVTHRPISRTQIFCGKAIAGLTLYFLAAGLPLAGAIIWSATPGKMAAPFEWHMALPAIWDLLNGSVWYFAGLLVAARNARWFGSRIMPLGVPFIGTAVAFLFAMNIGEALLVTGIILLMLIPPALGNFVYAGIFMRQPRASRALQTFAVALGWGLVFGIACAMAVEAMNMLSSDYGRYSNGVQYMIDKAGQPMKVFYENGALTRITDLNGQPIETTARTQTYTLQLSTVYLSFIRNTRENTSELQYRTMNSLHRKSYSVRFGDSPYEVWFYVVNRKIFEGYEYRSRRFVGRIGPEGFAAPGQTARPFDLRMEVRYGPEPIVYNSQNVYHLDVEKREIRPLFIADADDPILSAAYHRPGNEDDEVGAAIPATAGAAQEFLAVLTPKRIRVISEEREALNLARLTDQDSFRPLSVQIGKVVNGPYILAYHQYGNPDPKISQRIVEVNELGQIIKQTDLPSLPPMSRIVHWWEMPLQMAAIPPIGMLSIFIIAKIAEKPFQMRDIWLVIGCTVGIGAVCAGIAMAIASRYSFKRIIKGTWMAFCSLTGIPGILTLISVRDLPARVPCPKCGKPRVVTSDICEHCNAPFPPPQMQGIEIFE